MSENKKLLPCPFCGGEAEIITREYGNCKTKYVQCKDCECRTKEMFECCCDRERAEERAVKIWNSRTYSCKKQEG